MIIYFLRHASAGQRKADPQKDEKRPLDKDGISQSRDVGRLLASLDVQVDVLFSSALKRAMQTASLVGNELAYEGKIHSVSTLRPEATFAQFKELLQANVGNEALMVVGHNPNLSEFASLLLTSGRTRTIIDLPKAGVAKVELERKKPAVLKWCITPKLVQTLQASSASNSSPKTSRK